MKREKTSQAFRDAISDRYKSSKATRKRKRTEEKQSSVQKSQQTTNTQSRSTSPTELENIQIRLPFASQHDFHSLSSAGAVSSNSQTVVFNNDFHNIQQSTAPTSISLPTADDDLQYTEHARIFSSSIHRVDNDVNIQQQMTNDLFSEVSAIHHPVHFNPTSNRLQQRRLMPSRSNDMCSLISTQQQQYQMQQIPSHPHVASLPTFRDDTNNNTDRIPIYRDYSAFNLSDLEPTPIGENTVSTRRNTKQQQPSLEDSKPGAKK
jgi:hypothetical protein